MSKEQSKGDFQRHYFAGRIWRVWPADDASPLLAVELQAGTDHWVELLHLHQGRGQVSFAPAGKHWATAGLTEHSLLIGRLAEDPTVQDSQVDVYDLHTGEHSFELPGFQVEAYGQGCFWGRWLQEDRWHAARLQPTAGEAVLLDQLPPLDPKPTLWSTLVEPDTEHHGTLVKFMATFAQAQAVGPVEYAEHRGHVVVAYYTQEGAKFSQHLRVFDAQGSCLHSTVLARELAKFGTESFCLVGGRLIFTSEQQQTLCVYTLPGADFYYL